MDPEALHHPVGARDAPVGHVPDGVVGRLGVQRDEVPERVVRALRLRDLPVRMRLARVNDVGELDRVLDEEHRDVVAHQVEDTLAGVELRRKTAGVPHRVGRAPRPQHRGEPHEHRRLHPLGQERRLGHRARGAVPEEDTVSRRAPGVHDPLRDPLVVEVRDLLPQVVVLQQHRAARTGLQRVVRVRQPRSQCGGQVAAVLRRRVGRHAGVTAGGRQRQRRLLVRLRGQRSPRLGRLRRLRRLAARRAGRPGRRPVLVAYRLGEGVHDLLHGAGLLVVHRSAGIGSGTWGRERPDRRPGPIDAARTTIPATGGRPGTTHPAPGRRLRSTRSCRPPRLRGVRPCPFGAGPSDRARPRLLGVPSVRRKARVRVDRRVPRGRPRWRPSSRQPVIVAAAGCRAAVEGGKDGCVPATGTAASWRRLEGQEARRSVRSSACSSSSSRMDSMRRRVVGSWSPSQRAISW